MIALVLGFMIVGVFYFVVLAPVTACMLSSQLSESERSDK